MNSTNHDLIVQSPTPVNPWQGLASYTEQDRDNFFGREREVGELIRLIERDTLTVLFGQSGFGKTSLLRAGVIPILKDSGFFPVFMRIDYSGEALHPVAQVKALIMESAKTAQVEIETIRDGEVTLWEFFQATRFWGCRNDLLKPILVFDQFEEVFTLGRGIPETGEFLEQLADLIENRVPRILRKRAETADERISFQGIGQDIKVIFSLREDYVSKLDSLRMVLPAIMRNRFSLQPLDAARALEVVLGPGRQWVTEAVANSIVQAVGGDVAENGLLRLSTIEKEIEPAYLSVMCHELFRRMLATGGDEITEGLVAQEQGDILEGLYERSFEGILPSTRLFVEERLLTDSGFRNSVPFSEAIEEGVPSIDFDTLVNRRLLRFEDRLGTCHIELSHDLLARIVQKSRDFRRQKESEEEEKGRQAELRERLRRSKRHTLLLGSTACLLACAILVYLFGWVFNHTTYYKGFSKRYGTIHPIGSLTSAAIKHRSWSIQVVSTGWFGRVRVQAAKAVDSMGNLTSKHNIGTYFTDSYSISSTKEKECQWELTYDREDRVVYEVARDRFGRMVWGFVHSPNNAKDSKLPDSTTGMFVGSDGYPQPQSNSRAEYVTITYDRNGFERYNRYSDREGNPAPGPYGAYEWLYESDGLGRLTKAVSLGEDGKPMINNIGCAQLEIKYDNDGNPVECRILDTNGKLTLGNDGWAISRMKYDKWGNVLEKRLFDANNQSVMNNDNGAIVVSMKYDDHGNLISQSFFGSDGNKTDGHLKGEDFKWHELIQEYDNQNRVTSEYYLDTLGKNISNNQGWHKVKIGYDSQGFVNSKAFLDAEDHPCIVNGFHKIDYVNDSFGHPVEERLYGLNNQKVVSESEGYHLKKLKYDKLGREIEESFFDINENPCMDKSVGAQKVVLSYDGFGNITQKEYWDTNKRVKSKEGYHRIISQYNDFGSITSEKYFGIDLLPVLYNGGHEIRRTYDKNGKVTEEKLLGVHDEPVNGTSGIHRVVYENNDKGQVTRTQYFDKDGGPSADKDKIHLLVKKYDEQGRLIKITALGKDGEARLDPIRGVATYKKKFDDDGSWIEDACYDAHDNLVIGPYGNAKACIIRSKEGNYSESVNYDSGGKILFNTLLGYAIKVDDNTKDGVSVQSYLGPDRKLIRGPQGWAECRIEKDPQGEVIREEYFDENRQPAYCCDGYHRMEKKAGTLGEKRYFDTSGHEIADYSNGKQMIGMIYIEQVVSLDTVGAHIGLQAGDILWQFGIGSWSLKTALVITQKEAPSDDLLKHVVGFEAAVIQALKGPTRMVIIRNDSLIELSVPVLSINGLGIQLKPRYLPRSVYDSYISKIEQNGKK